MTVGLFVSAAALSLAILFVGTALHKARILRAGHAALQPILQAQPRFVRHAALALSLAALAEVGAAVALAVVPEAGYVATLGILAVYSLELRHLEPGQACRCFGTVAGNESRRGAQARNAILLIWCAGALVAYVTGAVAAKTPTVRTVSAALLIVSVPAAVVALRASLDITQSHSTAGR